jgi:hypothetical protein
MLFSTVSETNNHRSRGAVGAAGYFPVAAMKSHQDEGPSQRRSAATPEVVEQNAKSDYQNDPARKSWVPPYPQAAGCFWPRATEFVIAVTRGRCLMILQLRESRSVGR